MNYLKIQNKGELDVRLISLMGGTTKAKDDFKIGQFGTGLKYTLAYLSRNNIDFKIFVGEKEISIFTKPETIQGTTFNVLYIDNERTSITDTMGLDWKGWMIVRELWCNALDEGGAYKREADIIEGKAGTTTFYLQMTGEIKETWENWGDYFLHSAEPVYETNQFAVYPPTQTLKLYKNGILIHEDKASKGIFSYDIKNAEINELREYKGYISSDISNILVKLDKKSVDVFLTNLNKSHYEYEMDYDCSWHKFEDSWKEIIGAGKIITQKSLDIISSREIEIDTVGLIVVPPSLFKKLSHQFVGISATRMADKVNSFYEIYDAQLEQSLKEALVILESCGYFIDPELKFIYGIFGDKNVFAKINIDTKEIMFSEALKTKGLFDLITTVIEENEHYRTSIADGRQFQQHFINLYTKELLEKNKIKV